MKYYILGQTDLRKLWIVKSLMIKIWILESKKGNKAARNIMEINIANINCTFKLSKSLNERQYRFIQARYIRLYPKVAKINRQMRRRRITRKKTRNLNILARVATNSSEPITLKN